MEVEGEVARVCSDTLLGFEVGGEWEEIEGDDTEDVRAFFSDGAEPVVAEDEGAEGAADGGGAGATTLANDRPLKLWLGERVGDDLFKMGDESLSVAVE